jgi:hypothetical protein
LFILLSSIGPSPHREFHHAQNLLQRLLGIPTHSIGESQMRWIFFLAFSLTSLGGPAIADAPLPPPRPITVCNTSASHCAHADPATRTTRLVAQSSREVLWSIDRYCRFFMVSNDGRSILAQSEYANLAPLNASRDHALFVIYRDGKPIQTVTLGALFNSVSELAQTASHYSWGKLHHLDPKDNAVFILDDGRKVTYSLITGARAIP